MKLLITGSNGYVGSELVRQALFDGHQLVAMVRAHPPAEWASISAIQIIRCDLSNDEIPALNAYGIDCAIHLAAEMRPDSNSSHEQMMKGTNKLIASLQQAGIDKLVGISSMSVLDYESLSVLSLVDEHVKAAHQFNRMGKYSVFKTLQESSYMSFAVKPSQYCTILRPGLIYDDQLLSAAHAGLIKGGLQILVNHAGEVPVVHLTSVVDAILKAAHVTIANNEVINLVDEGLPRQRQYQEILQKKGKILKGKVSINWLFLSWWVNLIYACSCMVGLSKFIPEIMLPHAYSARLKPFEFSNSKAKRLLAWKPQYFKM